MNVGFKRSIASISIQTGIPENWGWFLVVFGCPLRSLRSNKCRCATGLALRVCSVRKPSKMECHSSILVEWVDSIQVVGRWRKKGWVDSNPMFGGRVEWEESGSRRSNHLVAAADVVRRDRASLLELRGEGTVVGERGHSCRWERREGFGVRGVSIFLPLIVSEWGDSSKSVERPNSVFEGILDSGMCWFRICLATKHMN